MILKEKNSIFIPKGSFITTFSNSYLDRNNVTALVACSALFNTNLNISYNIFETFFKNFDDIDEMKYTPDYVINDYYKFFLIYPELPSNFDKTNNLIRLKNLTIIVTDFKTFANQLICYDIPRKQMNRIFCAFIKHDNWHWIAAKFFNDYNIFISGGDVSKRHMVSPVSINLHFFLLILCKANRSLLRRMLLFSIDKQLLIPGKPKQKNSHSSVNINQKRLFHTNSNLRDSNPSYNQNINLYSNIKNFFQNNPHNKDSQLKLEKYLVDFSYAHHEDVNISGIEKSLFNKKIFNFLLPFEPLLLSKIEKFISKKSYYDKDSFELTLVEIITHVNPRNVLSIIFGIFLKIISNERKNLHEDRNIASSITLDISSTLIRDYFYSLYQIAKNTPDYSFNDWKMDNQEFIKKHDTPYLLIKIGGMIIEWMIDSDLINLKIIEKGKGTDEYGKLSILSLNNNFQDTNNTLLQANSETINMFNQIISLPMKLPMICKPKPYKIKSNGRYSLGGFLLNDEKFIDDIILSNHYFKECSRLTSNMMYNVINNINSVGYKINTPLLKFIEQNDTFFDDDLLNPNITIPETKLTNKEKKILQHNLSKIDLQQNILGIAHAYSDLSSFYFVNRIDSRGRLYCMNEYLNYQGSDLAKCLLLFSKPSKVERLDQSALNFLKAFGANCYGNKIDKLSMEKKINWVDLNIKLIQNFRDGILIKQSENKFLFSAFCFEMERWLEFERSEQLYFEAFLPIQLDATCNGFQHLALLGLDSNLSSELNLTKSTHKDTPKDFYTHLVALVVKNFITKMDVITRKLNNSLDTDNLTISERVLIENKETYERLINFNIHRKLIKKVIMTIPYNATDYRLVKNIKELLETSWKDDEDKWWYTDKLNEHKKLSYKDIDILVDEIREILYTNFPILKELINYLSEVAKICAKLDLYIPWILPNGLEVKQSYLKEKSIQIKPFTYSKNKFTLRAYLDEYDKNIQVRAFMPNLIHSLDSCTLSLLVNDYFNSDLEIKNIYTIHDCFAMPMNCIEYVIDSLKINYIKIYSETTYLKKLDEQIINHIKAHYGENCYDPETRIISHPGLKFKLKYPNINVVLLTEFDFESLKKSENILI